MSRDDEDRRPEKWERPLTSAQIKQQARFIPACFRTAEFEALKKEWDAKLAADGFVDIEKDDDKGWAPKAAAGKVNALQHATAMSTADMYEMMEQYTDVHRWKSRRERILWVARAQGELLSRIIRKHPLGLTVPYRTAQRLQLSILQKMLAENQVGNADELIAAMTESGNDAVES